MDTSIIIIGAGTSGLCAGFHLFSSGYKTHMFEIHNLAVVAPLALKSHLYAAFRARGNHVRDASTRHMPTDARPRSGRQIRTRRS